MVTLAIRTALFVSLCSVALSGPACAALPVYVDDVSLTSGGVVLFSDGFTSGKLDGWVAVNGASITRVRPNPPGYCVCLFPQEDWVASITRSASANNSDVLELSGRFYLPAPGATVRSGLVALRVLSGTRLGTSSRKDSVWVGLVWNNKRGGYNVDVHWDAKSVCAGTVNGGVKPKTWVTVTLRFNRSTGRIAALVGGKEASSTRCSPQNFEVIEGVSVESRFDTPGSPGNRP